MTINLRVSLDFTGYSDPDLDEFAGNVVVSLTGNASFSVPPVEPGDLGALNTAFHNAVLAALPGGIQLTAAKNAARNALLDALRKEASYVQSITPGHDLDVLLTSGFYANSTNRAQSPLTPPTISDLENLAATKLLVRLTPVTNAKSYNVQPTPTEPAHGRTRAFIRRRGASCWATSRRDDLQHPRPRHWRRRRLQRLVRARLAHGDIARQPSPRPSPIR